MKIPLRELKSASDHISNNDLTYEIDYRCNDEMGILCKDFEKMRSELVKNEKKVWNLIEDERTLRSSIAHDIRTPITLIPIVKKHLSHRAKRNLVGTAQDLEEINREVFSEEMERNDIEKIQEYGEGVEGDINDVNDILQPFVVNDF